MKRNTLTTAYVFGFTYARFYGVGYFATEK